LQVVGFDEQTWTEINHPIHDRVEDRLQNTRFLTDPDAIVKRAEAILSSKTSTWADLAVGLGVVIGRRLSELLGLKDQARTYDRVLDSVFGPAQTSRRACRL
jgi:hypothetical protein